MKIKDIFTKHFLRLMIGEEGLTLLRGFNPELNIVELPTEVGSEIQRIQFIVIGYLQDS